MDQRKCERFGFDKNKIAVQGVLAGGHLALMLGLTRNENKLEGDVGNYLSEDSKISCVVSGFSPSNLEERWRGSRVTFGGEIDNFQKKLMKHLRSIGFQKKMNYLYTCIRAMMKKKYLCIKQIYFIISLKKVNSKMFIIKK